MFPSVLRAISFFMGDLSAISSPRFLRFLGHSPANPRESLPRGIQCMSAVPIFSGTEVAGPQELSLLKTQLNLHLTQQRFLESPLRVPTKSQMSTNQKQSVASLFL